MIEVHGHVMARAQLERELPAVTLLRGPESVGKWTLATYLAQYHNFEAVDTRMYPAMDMEAARDIVSFSERRPFGQFKCVIAQLDTASSRVQTTLLKLLEEPPSVMRFLLVAAKPVLDTVVSRASLVSMGLLSESEIYSVLHERLGMVPDQARKAAALARGQVGPAMLAASLEPSKDAVRTVLRALVDSDLGLINRIAETRRDDDGPVSWGPDEHYLLQLWAIEAITGRWRVFSKADSYGLERHATPRLLLGALGNPSLANARPALAMRVALATIVKGV